MFQFPIHLFWIGKTKQSYVNKGFEDYQQRMKRYGGLLVKELPHAKHKNSEVVKETEAKTLLKHCKPNDYIVLLDEAGKDLNTRTFAEFVADRAAAPGGRLIFCIGGAYGFHATVKQRAQYKIRLSSMTFSHQLIRLIFAEQIYRVMSLLNNHPYHND